MASADFLDVYAELRGGGEWLGTARRWMQSNVPRGDTLTWNSAEPVQLPFYKLEDLAQHVAIAAVMEERARVQREANLKKPPAGGPVLDISF